MGIKQKQQQQKLLVDSKNVNVKHMQHRVYNTTFTL